MTSPGVEGKVVIVTGAGRGIGQDIALLYARRGAKVVVNDLGTSVTGEGRGDAPAQQVAEAIRAEGGHAVANTDSVADPEGGKRMVAQAVAAFGRLDIVVNNAGIIREMPFDETPFDTWDATLKVHLYGSFQVARAAADRFRDQRDGVYIHMTSSTALIGNRDLSAYMAAKMGVVGLSRSIAIDMAKYGVRSNCISPAASTRMSPPRKTAEQDAAYKALVRGEQVAPLAVFLGSEAARSITGQVIGVRRNELYLYSQPRPVRTLHRSEGWTVETLTEQLVPAWKTSFVPLEETHDVFAWAAI
jgi:NAD(P)-dependent dehydrogenase (short-subunit alcohol dehydrogenase family)